MTTSPVRELPRRRLGLGRDFNLLWAGTSVSLIGSVACGAITHRIGIGQASLWTLFGECVGFLIMPFAPAGHTWVAVPCSPRSAPC